MISLEDIQPVGSNSTAFSVPEPAAGLNLTISARYLQLLLGSKSSYGDFCEIVIPSILSKEGLVGYSCTLDDSNHRHYSLDLALIIVRSNRDFSGLMGAILIQEAIAGIHSQLSLMGAIISLLYMTHVRKQWVNAREFHRFLGVKQPFCLWINRRITELGMVQGRDYSRCCWADPSMPRYHWEIFHTSAIDMAMVEKSPRGHSVRRYFIDREKELKLNPARPWENLVEPKDGHSHVPAFAQG